MRDRIRQEVNKYTRRELRKPLPEGFDRWEFACKVGATAAEAQPRVLKEVGGAIDAVAATGASQVYVEIEAAPLRRERPAESEE